MGITAADIGPTEDLSARSLGIGAAVWSGATLPIGVGSGGRLLSGEAPSRGGWIESVEDRAPGVASVSAPVLDRAGTIVAAISVSGPIDRIGRSPGKRHGAEVVAAARALEALL